MVRSQGKRPQNDSTPQMIKLRLFQRQNHGIQYKWEPQSWNWCHNDKSLRDTLICILGPNFFGELGPFLRPYIYLLIILSYFKFQAQKKVRLGWIKTVAALQGYYFCLPIMVMIGVDKLLDKVNSAYNLIIKLAWKSVVTHTSLAS